MRTSIFENDSITFTEHFFFVVCLINGGGVSSRAANKDRGCEISVSCNMFDPSYFGRITRQSSRSVEKKEKTSLAKIFCSTGHNLLCIHVLRVK